MVEARGVACLTLSAAGSSGSAATAAAAKRRPSSVSIAGSELQRKNTAKARHHAA